jgi:hypothetical protein
LDTRGQCPDGTTCVKSNMDVWPSEWYCTSRKGTTEAGGRCDDGDGAATSDSCVKDTTCVRSSKEVWPPQWYCTVASGGRCDDGLGIAKPEACPNTDCLKSMLGIFPSQWYCKEGNAVTTTIPTATGPATEEVEWCSWGPKHGCRKMCSKPQCEVGAAHLTPPPLSPLAAAFSSFDFPAVPFGGGGANWCTVLTILRCEAGTETVRHSIRWVCMHVELNKTV